MKDINEMSDHEILIELLEEKRRNDRIRYIQYAFDAVVILALLVLGFIYIPKIVNFVKQVNQLVEDYKQLVGRLNLTEVKIDEFMNSFGSETGVQLKEFIERFEALMSRFGF